MDLRIDDPNAQLTALGDATRRAILAQLLNGPLPVGKLAREFPVSRPAISQHLRVLKDAHLVTDRAAGTRRLYALNPEAFSSLRTYFDHFWTQALEAFKRRIEQDQTPEHGTRTRATLTRARDQDPRDTQSGARGRDPRDS